MLFNIHCIIDNIISPLGGNSLYSGYKAEAAFTLQKPSAFIAHSLNVVNKHGYPHWAA
jgi:hypothetical protein